MTTSDLRDLVTAIVAVAGLILSLYVLYLRQREKRPRVTTTLAIGFLPRGPDLGNPMLLMTVANPGERKVIITGVEIDLGDRKAVFPWGIQGTQRLPFELRPGESATFWTPVREFALRMAEQGFTGTVQVRACSRDAVGEPL